MSQVDLYISITGLELKQGPLRKLRFWWHAIRSMAQVRGAPGNISADARTIDGVHHTLTVWTDEAAMRRYLVSGAHMKAMRVFHNVATGKTLGFSAQMAPLWDEVHDLWKADGKPVCEYKPKAPQNLNR